MTQPPCGVDTLIESHNANLGCNKCYKNFSDCTSSEFDRRSWIKRTNRSDCAEILKETTTTGISAARYLD